MLIKVNAHYQDFDIYCGRHMPKRGLKGSPLGNPYPVNSFNGKAVIELYRFWLWDRLRLRDDPPVIDELITIIGFNQVHGDCRLACWCAPRPCHVDVIIRALQTEAVTLILSEEIYKRGVKL